MNFSPTQSPVLRDLLLSQSELVRAFAVDPTVSADVSGITGFHKPTDVLVSRWFPGYRVAILSGPDAEEALALLLAEALAGEGALEEFRMLLSSPAMTTRVVAELFPRANQALPTRDYLVSEAFVHETVTRAMGAGAQESLIDAFSYVIVRVLTSGPLNMVQVSEEKRLVGIARSFALGYEEIRRLMLIDALRGVFSDSRIAEVGRALDSKCTPQVLADVLARMFRQISHVIPEIQLRLQQIDVALGCVRTWLRSPEDTPLALRAHGPLINLASVANFMAMAVLESPIELASPASVEERKDACTAVLSTIQSSPSVEMMSLAGFSELVGCVPVTTADGTRRGAVLYGYHGQTARFDVVDVRKQGGGRTELALLSPEYARLSTISSVVNTTVGSIDALTSLVNIVADEIAREDRPQGGTETSPYVVMFNVPSFDALVIAMHRADTVALARTDLGGDVPGPVRLILGCSKASQWRSRAFAATPEVVFLDDPYAVLLYTSAEQMVEPRPLPSRAQTIGAVVGRDMVYLGDTITELLNPSVQRAFNVDIPVFRGTAEPITLKLSIGLISHLLGWDKAKGVRARGDSFYAGVMEPGVDPAMKLLFDVALGYSNSTDKLLADRAKSWLVEYLAPLVTHPAVQGAAERALNEAVIEARLDLRTIQSSYKETVVRACFGTVLSVFARFNKLDPSRVAELITVVPVSGISVRAQVALASMPVTLPTIVDR